MEGRIRRRIAVLWLLFAVSGCRSEPQPVAVPVDETIERTSLTVFPADSLLHDVRDVGLGKDGAVWVLSANEPHLRRYSSLGELEAVFASNGDGPGELRNPWYLDVGPDSSGGVQVWDAGKRRMETFTHDGEYTGGVTLRAEIGVVMAGIREGSHGEPYRARSYRGGFALEAYDGQVNEPKHYWKGKILLFDNLGEVTGTLVAFDDLRGQAREELPELFPPIPLWTRCGSSRIGLLHPTEKTIRWFGPTPEVTWQVPDLLSPPVPDGAAARLIRHSIEAEAREQGIDPDTPGLGRFIRTAIARMTSSAPETGPPVLMRCDGLGRVWVQAFSPEHDPRGFGRLWQVFTEDSHRSVAFPPGFQPLAFGRDYAAGYLVDQLGIQRIAVTRLPTWPAGM